MKKILSLMLAFVMLFALAMPAMAIEPPYMVPEKDIYTVTQGEKVDVKFNVYVDSYLDTAEVELHKDEINGVVVARASQSLASVLSKTTTYTVGVDTADLNLEPGIYYLQYWVSTLSYSIKDNIPNGKYYLTIKVKGQPCKGAHSYDDGVVTVAATCSKEGSLTKTCTICGNTGTFSIPKTEHIWDGGVVNKEASAISAGSKIYKCKECNETKTETIPAKFTDVDANKYYAAAVDWAYNNSVTSGISDNAFGPDSGCTRGQVLTFLWRAMGCPEPTTTENPFKDVKSSDYYYKPILWGVEKGITGGTSATTFSPNDSCSYAHILTFIWRAQDKPGFTGAGEWYADAFKWANDNNLLDKTNAAQDVKAACPRRDVVTYLYRILNK